MSMQPLPHSDIGKFSIDPVVWLRENQHLCRLPWSNLQFFEQEKSIKPCCSLINNNQKNLFEPLNEVRSSIESGHIHPRCQVCCDDEKDGKVSERMRSLITLTSAEMQKFVTEKTYKEFYIHATMSNLCNMACRSCDENVSSLYYKIWRGHEPKISTMSENFEYWEVLLKTIESAVTQHEEIILVISGGEGMIQPDFFKLINWIKERGINKHLTLQITTNGSVNDRDLFLNLINDFKEVRLSVSVDSVYENYYYVRWPVKWEKISRNLESFVEFKKNFKNFNFSLSPVFGINNIFYLTDYVKFFGDFSKKHNIGLRVYDMVLHHPQWMDAQYLPQYLKEKLSTDIETILDHEFLHEEGNIYFLSSVKSMYQISKMITNIEIADSVWTDYLRITARWDTLTGAKFSEHNKKLFDCINDHDKEKFKKFQLSQSNNIRNIKLWKNKVS